MLLRNLTAASCAVFLWLSLSCSSDSAGTRDIQFAETVRPPCVSIPGSDRDPCQRKVEPIGHENPSTNAHGFRVPPLPFDPEWLFRLEWSRQGVRTPQLVVRGVVVPNSGRCSEVKAYNLGGDHGRIGTDSSRTRELCHVDFRVSEYIVGSGPARFSVIAIWRGSVSRSASGYGSKEYFGELVAPIRNELEGGEFIIELSHPHDLAWGEWRSLHAWDIQRREDGTVIGQSGMWRFFSGSTDIEDWEIPLDELQPKLKAAHAKIAAEYGGRISDEPDSPMLVTNAGRSHLLAQLRELGAYDAPDITPVPAPPAPIPPIEPGDVAASQPNDDGGILISWSASPSGDAVGYKIVRRVPKGEFVTVVADTGSTDTSYTDTSAPMTAGTTYIYRVLALNEYGESVASRPANIRVP